MVKKEISSVKNWKEAFWETALCSLNSSQRVTAFPSKSHSLRLFLWNLQSDNWKPLEGYGEIEISSIRNRKEAFWETALCSVNSSHRVTPCPSRRRSLSLFLWNLQSDISKPKECYCEKGNIFSLKLQRSFLRDSFVFSEFISQSYSFPSRNHWLRLFLWNLRSDNWKSMEGYGETGNIFS